MVTYCDIVTKNTRLVRIDLSTVVNFFYLFYLRVELSTISQPQKYRKAPSSATLYFYRYRRNESFLNLIVFWNIPRKENYFFALVGMEGFHSSFPWNEGLQRDSLHESFWPYGALGHPAKLWNRIPRRCTLNVKNWRSAYFLSFVDIFFVEVFAWISLLALAPVPFYYIFIASVLSKSVTFMQRLPQD